SPASPATSRWGPALADVAAAGADEARGSWRSSCEYTAVGADAASTGAPVLVHQGDERRTAARDIGVRVHGPAVALSPGGPPAVRRSRRTPVLPVRGHPPRPEEHRLHQEPR